MISCNGGSNMNQDLNDTIFFISKDDAQSLAKNILGRKLTRFELKNVTETVEEGFSEWQDFLKNTILLAAGNKQKISNNEWAKTPRFFAER